MAKEWSPSALVDVLTAAGPNGLTTSALKMKIPAARRSGSTSILADLRSAGVIQGPFKKKSDYYFAPQFAPTRLQVEESIEKLLRDAGLKLATRSELSDKVKGFLQVFFRDALASLKSEAKIIELKRGRSTFYVHREPLLDQLNVTDDAGFEAGPSGETPDHPPQGAAVALEDVRPVYEKLKAEQGGIGTVKIYDIMSRLGVSKADLHRLLLEEERNGRVSLHRASTARFSLEVREAGIRLPGQPEPLVTVVLKE
jgi:hypothetical protein